MKVEAETLCACFSFHFAEVNIITSITSTYIYLYQFIIHVMDTMLKSLFTCFLAKTRRGVSWKNRGHGPGGCCYSDWGCYSQLLRELDEEDPPSYRSWLRMDKDAFNFLLRMVEPQTRGRDAQLCEAILAGECLTITLRYLATGFTFSALEYTFCVSQHNILNCYLDLQRHV